MGYARTQQIEGREIRVYDSLLNHQDIQALTALFEGGAFVRNEVARPDTAVFRHWALNIPLETAIHLPVYAPTLAAVQNFRADRQYRLYRCYCNHAAYGDMLFTHTDCLPGEQHLTTLWYVAPEWNVEWGGETVFFNSRHDAEAVVSPRPGRLVVFDGSLTHVGRPPNRVCYVPRYTLALKFNVTARHS